MNVSHHANLSTKITAEAVVKIENPNLAMDEACQILADEGNDIISFDEEKREIVILNTVTHPVETMYVCDYCGAYSRSESVTKEHELNCKGGN